VLAEVEPTSDLHASAAYRRRVGVTLCIRALERRAPMPPRYQRKRAMKVDLRINGAVRSAEVEPRKTLLDALRENFLLADPCRLRARRLRRLHVLIDGERCAPA